MSSPHVKNGDEVTHTQTAITMDHSKSGDVVIYPGTEIMADVGDLHFVKSSHNRVLVPQPSSDPADPLNWSPLWKTIVMVISTYETFLFALGPLSIAPQVPAYMKEWDRSLADVLQFTGVAILVLGFSNFFWVPIATLFGRRPAMIFSSTCVLASMIWRAKSNSYASFMGASVLNGFGSGPAETLQPIIVADVIFLHDRGKYMGIYMWSYFGGLMIGPIIAGPMTTHYGWQSFWWLNAGMSALLLLLSVFLLPETKFRRKTQQLERVHLDRENGNSTHRNNSSEQSETKESAAGISEGVENADQVKNADAANLENVGGAFDHQRKGAPKRSQWNLMVHLQKDMLKDVFAGIWIPFYMFTMPIIQFSSFVFSWSASCFLYLNLTQSQAFAAPPYNFTEEKVGLLNLATLVGACIGLATAGPLSDRISMKATMKNRGIREPEMRLPTLIPFTIIMVIGMVIVGVGCQYGWPWPAIVVLGYALIGLQVTTIPAIAITYSIDSYKPVAGEFLVSATINKNVWGYGVAKFLTPWIIEKGYIPAFMVNMALTLVFCLCAVPLYYGFGKKCRGWTSKSRIHEREKIGDFVDDGIASPPKG